MSEVFSIGISATDDPEAAMQRFRAAHQAVREFVEENPHVLLNSEWIMMCGPCEKLSVVEG